MTIGEWLNKATKKLSDSQISTARLDSLILLQDVLDKDKTWILAHSEQQLTPSLKQRLDTAIARRSGREPMAYIRKRQEFYGREFKVSTSVLIPRPETETLIDLVKAYIDDGDLLDVGTGSGAIAITCWLENPKLTVDACDISDKALEMAKFNAGRLKAEINFFKSDLLDQVSKKYDLLAANLPYVDKAWKRSPETNHEPSLALFAGDGGLSLIKKLISDAPKKLRPSGYVLLEADPVQHESIIDFAKKQRFKQVETRNYAVLLRKLA